MNLLKPFLKIFTLTTAIIIALLVYIMFIRQPHYFLYAERWLINLYKGKDFINEMPTNKKRILIVSGSNSLFGFNGEVIDKATNFKPINYASNAGLPLNFHIDRVMQHAKNGDAIFLPLEFHYYRASEPQHDIWYIHNMLSWGNGYDKYISTRDKITGYLKNSPSRSIEWFFKGFNPKYKDEFDTQKMFHNPPFDFGYTSLSKYGDFCTQEGELSERVNSGYLGSDLQLSTFFLSEYARLESFAKSHNIKVFLVFPVTLENPQFSLQDSNTYEKINNLVSQLAKHNIKIYGNFEDSHFERKYFYNTEYHLNASGTILRSQNFAKLLESLEKNGEI
ncbi:hypothetical protein DCO58_09985 [Helicobacter saguini]|uniref:D-alanyl-lipoteichoic acid biosynthesis protein DltD n=1 Tax=Helicobacter saguini TaxID=1548018 RepID=A0A347VPG9_9HELI|nr:hypothetical protein [Helicobacter saguini]MWV61365.1 hypothetical protein [Helicobacter saguini]MWV67966.1 hypothetical protein [Helicobacter saguini]MWV70567.1 hypothetical protein [Helicobacter saguini]MWV72470.1 hypothetical protein [Helicobacter saguini]TLD94777.1 hypothetical protein LS64_004550 [Helicobacter saguini]